MEKARTLSNPDLAPHLSFIDMGGHGYALVRASKESFETEFVCIPRPLERNERNDGGPILYRAAFRSDLWGKGETPEVKGRILEGSAPYSV